MSHPKDRIPPLSRREFLRRAAMTGVAVPGLAAILAACGSDDGNAGGASGSSPTAAGLQLARPDNPITLAITEDNPADRGRPVARGRTAQDLRLQRLRLEEGAEPVRRPVRRRRRVHGLRHAGRDGGEDAVERLGLRHPGHRHARERRQAGAGRADPAAQQDVPAHVRGPAVDRDPGLLRRGPPVLGALRGVHHRHLVAERPDHRRHRRHGQPVRHLLGHREQGPGPPAERQRATRWRRRCSAAATTRTSDDPAILDTIKQDLLDGADAMGWKYDHVDYTELSTNGWEVHGTWSGQMVYYQYYLPKGLDITSLSYSWPPQGMECEARPDLPRPVRHLEGRREPGAGAQVHRLHVRAGQRAHELHLRGLPAHRAVARQGRRRSTRAICRRAWTTRS